MRLQNSCYERLQKKKKKATKLPMLQDQQTQAFAHGKYFLNVLSKALETSMNQETPKLQWPSLLEVKTHGIPMQWNTESHHLDCCQPLPPAKRPPPRRYGFLPRL